MNELNLHFYSFGVFRMEEITEHQQNMLDYLNCLDNKIVEVRIQCKDFYALGYGKRTGTTCFGYYDKENYIKLVKDIQPFVDSEQVEGIYVTIQDIDIALLARADNRIRLNAKTGETTSMTNVLNYVYFPIDIDPDRASKISSSKDEMIKAKETYDYLGSELFKDFEMIRGMSGNGFHLIIPIKPLQYNEENAERWKRVGSIIAEDIVDKRDGVSGDTMVYTNPTLKLYGTFARKGDSTSDRPHRRSKVKLPEIIDFDTKRTIQPAELKKHDFSEIEKIILPLEDKDRVVPKSVFSGNHNKNKYNSLKEFLDKHSIEYDAPKDTPEGTVFPMTCVFDESHGKDSFAIQKTDGRWGWKCFHNSCQGLGWHDFRKRVAPKQAFQDANASRGYVERNPDGKTFTIHDIQDIDDAPDDRVEFPMEAMEGLPEVMLAACSGRKDLQPEFLHGVTFNNIGAVLGRRVFVQDDPPVFPNQYTIIVGTTGMAQKTHVTKLGKAVLKMADQNVIRQTALATAEGLINLFVFPNRLYPGCEIPDDYEEWFNNLEDKHRKGMGRWVETFSDEARNLRSMVEQSGPEEGFRVQLVQNELSALLSKGKKASGSGLTQTVTELYDMEDIVTSPTKTNPTIAYFPCLSIVGSTTQTWLEKYVDIDDIHAGFINRFAFYMSGDVDLNTKRMFNPPIDKGGIQSVAKALSMTRNAVTAEGMPKGGRAYTVHKEAVEYSEQWHTDVIKQIASIDNEIVRDSLSRFALHCKKFSLIYAIFDNNIEDSVISLKSMEKACILTKYHISVARRLFGDFASNEMQKVEDLVYKKIRGSGIRGTTAREIANSTRRASLEQVIKAIESLEKSHFIGKNPIPYNPGRFRYFALKEVDLDSEDRS